MEKKFCNRGMPFLVWIVCVVLLQSVLAVEVAMTVDKTRSSVEAISSKGLRASVLKNLIDDMIAIPGKPYRLGKTEVTEAQWDVVMKKDPSFIRTGKFPVGGVSWDSCQEFIKKLNLCQEVQSSGLKFRLPTVAEWQYACRAGGRGNWGMLSKTQVGDLPEMGWYADNSNNGKSPVAQKKPNAWGLYDMHGNLFEWCADVSPEYGGDFRCRVGGSYNSPAAHCTVRFVNSAYRQFSDYANQGFRLLAELAH